MRKLLLLVVLTFVASFVFGQVPFMDFETEPAPGDTTFWVYSQAPSTDTTKIDISYITDQVFEGSKAMQLDYRVEDSESWGGFAKLEHFPEDSTKTFDFSAFTQLKFRYYIDTPQSIEGAVTFRVCLWDVSNSNRGDTTSVVDNAEYWYSFHKILDAEPGWNEETINLEGVLGADESNPSIFQLTQWTGITGNAELDLDKIKAVAIELSIATSQPDPGFSEGTIIVDDFTLEGQAELPLVFFNGKAVPSDVDLSAWSGSAGVEEGAGIPTSGGQATNAVKWVGGDQWSGPTFTLNQAKDLRYRWPLDTLKFDIKAEAGLGQLRVDFWDTDMDGDGTEDYPFEAHYNLEESAVGYDGTWKHVEIPLQDFDRAGGFYDTSFHPGMFDSSKTAGFRVLNAGGGATGQTVYFDNIWTGNPSIDNEAPAAPANVSATPNTAAYYNLVTWTDVPGETGETYNVYASLSLIEDINGPGVDQVASGIEENTQSAIHYLYYPHNDTTLSYYYAVECVDGAGNHGNPAASSAAFQGTAKGIATISLDVPGNFAADGDFSEWSGIEPFEIMPSVNNVVIGGFDNDDDLTTTVWMAIDNTYLYIAADVIDNSYYFGEGDWWNQDAIEMFFGLYDYSSGAKHSVYKRGSEPDYNISIRPDGVHHQNKDQDVITTAEDFFWEDGGTQDYYMETRIRLDSLYLADDAGDFVPVEGMRIPMDIYMHDNDNGTAEGTLALSPFNTDHAWQYPTEWTYTWVGDRMTTGIKDEHPNVITEYRLEQNYPNPFNPSTTIQYSLAQRGDVTVVIYDVLGKQVAKLVNETQGPGEHQVKWDASKLSSGIYFYSIQSGQFNQTKKMILMK